MARKRGARKSNRHGGATLEESSEEFLDMTQDDELQQQSPAAAIDEDKFEVLIDYLYEKRAAARLHGLQGLVSLLCSSVWQEECLAREETLARLMCSCLRKGKETELVLAGRGLGLLMITLGLEDGADRVWQSCCKTLLASAAAKEKSATIRCAALDSYTVGCFIAEEDMTLTIEAMDKVKALWDTASDVVRACAIRCWTMLLSNLSSEMVDDMFEGVVEDLTGLLEDHATDVRRASGDALKLLYSFGMELEAEDMETSDGDSSVASTSTGFSRMSGIEMAMDRMKDIKGPKGQLKRKSKKDRTAMRTTCREICNFVEDGTLEGRRIKMQNGCVLTINDLPGLIQLNFIRKLLAEGFHVHLHDNELLHQIFQYSPTVEPQSKLTQTQKRMWKSPQSAANKLRTKQRRNGYAAKLELVEDVCF